MSTLLQIAQIVTPVICTLAGVAVMIWRTQTVIMGRIDLIFLELKHATDSQTRCFDKVGKLEDFEQAVYKNGCFTEHKTCKHPAA